MIDFTAIIQNTNAYRLIQSDKQKGNLSHAYLILTSDKDMLEDYVKLLVSLMCCETDGVCSNCRTCRLIADKAYLEEVMRRGADEARYYATKMMSKVRRKIGFVN